MQFINYSEFVKFVFSDYRECFRSKIFVISECN